MLRSISSVELAEWIAYSKLEPFGPQREDIRAGMIASTVANVNLAKDADPLGPQDFFPELK